MRQADATHWLLSDGTEVEILNLIDDHSRLVLASVSFPTIKAADVVQTSHEAAQAYGFPAAWLSDNAAVFSGESRRGKVIIETELENLGIRCIHSTPYHPQTCGKVERFHQTLKRFLIKQAAHATLAHLQLQLDAFRTYYNQQRPHRALAGQMPLTAFNAHLKAKPCSWSYTHGGARQATGLSHPMFEQLQREDMAVERERLRTLEDPRSAERLSFRERV
ncbi:MAG: integrase core domain-containing protein [Candidatus Dormibacteraeota bacterium]|nr:integrase core domain-containing protein [Candidatus Dormibacteraeota bacterium]